MRINIQKFDFVAIYIIASLFSLVITKLVFVKILDWMQQMPTTMEIPVNI